MKLLMSVAISIFMIWRTGQAPVLQLALDRAMTLTAVLQQALEVASR